MRATVDMAGCRVLLRCGWGRPVTGAFGSRRRLCSNRADSYQKGDGFGDGRNCYLLYVIVMTRNFHPYFFRQTLADLGGQPVMTCRAPSFATSTTAIGAGVATATISQISAESAKPASAPTSSQKAWRGPKCRITAKASRNTAAEADASTIREISMMRCSFCRLRQCSQVGEMQFVVPAHLRSQAGNIVAPSRKDFPYDRFHTLTHKRLNHRANERLQPDGFENFRLGCQQHTIVPQPLTAAERLFCRRSRDFGMVILFR